VARALDFVLRLAFFAAAPFLLVFIAALFPVTGAIAQVGLALAAFFASEALRRLVTRHRLAAYALSDPLAFEAYYRAHPPRPFLYYVFYPLLFPYWLVVPEARREFLLYKGYSLASFALVLLSLVAQYLVSFPPQLGVRDFLPIAGGSFVAETVVVLMFLMPITTTVVHYHQQRAPGRLAALLVVGLLSVSLAVWRIERRRDPVVSFATRMRVRMRTEAAPGGAYRAQAAALRAAWKTLPHERDDIDHDGKVQGEALQAAQDAMRTFYRNDEAHAFDLWLTRQHRTTTLVLYFEARRHRDPIWLALQNGAAIDHDARRLPRGAFLAMSRATQ